MISRSGNIEDGIEIRCLAGRCQDSRHTTLQLADFVCHCVIGRVRQSGIKITGILKIEKVSHLLGSLIFKGCRLHNGNHSGLSLFRLIAPLYADRINVIICHV